MLHSIVRTASNGRITVLVDQNVQLIAMKNCSTGNLLQGSVARLVTTLPSLNSWLTASIHIRKWELQKRTVTYCQSLLIFQLTSGNPQANWLNTMIKWSNTTDLPIKIQIIITRLQRISFLRKTDEMTKNHPCGENTDFWRNLAKSPILKCKTVFFQNYFAVNQCKLSPQLQNTFNSYYRLHQSVNN